MAEKVYLQHPESHEVKTLTDPDPTKDLVPLMVQGFVQISEQAAVKAAAEAEKAKAAKAAEKPAVAPAPVVVPAPVPAVKKEEVVTHGTTPSN